MIDPLVDLFFKFPLSPALFHNIFGGEVNNYPVVDNLAEIVNENAIRSDQFGIVLILFFLFKNILAFNAFFFMVDMIRIDV